MFKHINIANWRQFLEIDIEFDPKLTILTGANGSGKTTILNILKKHFGEEINFVSIPKRDNKSGILEYLTGILNKIKENERQEYIGANECIGNIEYDSNFKSNINVPTQVGNTFDIWINNQQAVNGLFISSHRTVFNYRQVNEIPTKALTRKDIYTTYNSFIKSYEKDTYRDTNKIASTLLIKETLIALATFGYGNEVVVKNNEAMKLFKGYEEILRKTLPAKLGFEKIEIEVPEVVLKTKSGRFSLDASSGGIAAIIELTWQIYMYDEQEKNYVVIIDEPENHLHPEIQRTLLPSLLNAFPNVQFIIATHNPFIISSVPASNVYVLDYNQENKVTSYSLDKINRAGSPNEILRDVLGIPSTTPIWVENKLNEVIDKYSKKDLTKEIINDMRNELTEYGFENLIPEALLAVVKAGEKN